MLFSAVSDHMGGFFDFIDNGASHGLDNEFHGVNGGFSGKVESEPGKETVALIVSVLELLGNLISFVFDHFFFITNIKYYT
jgi:hypothetical protein